MSTALRNLSIWWNARVTSAIEASQAREIERLTAALAVSTEALDIERSRNRVADVEVKELAAVIARNFERVQAETRAFGGNVVKADLMETGA